MKKEFKQLNVLTMPLEGMNLIEAGAGTGKTYTIANLYLRLVIEKGLSIREILVVTFTEAATKELRDRIRRILARAQAAFVRPGACDDDTIRQIVETAVKSGTSDAAALLHRALISFDEAAIFTIHGFCAGLLNDYCYECAVPFNTELVTDQGEMLQEIADDFWRTHFSAGNGLFPLIAVEHQLTPDVLSGFAGELVNKPLLRVVPDPPGISRKDMEERFEALAREWKKSADKVKDILMNDPALGRADKSYREDIVANMLSSMESAFTGALNGFFLTAVRKASTEVLNDPSSLLKKKGAPEHHPFFDLCGSFSRGVKDYVLYVRHAFIRYLKEELENRKQTLNVRSYDDLLLGVREALRSDRGEELAGAVRAKFRAALIDEFQDTDPVQYDIFKNLFTGTHGLFLIGDPKQSIYGFRGADIFSYIAAVEDTTPGKGHTLLKNWRSETALVEAVNLMFNRAQNPFALGPAIPFRDAASTEVSKGNQAPLVGEGNIRSGLVMGFLKRIPPDTKKGAGPNKDEARDTAFAWCAAEIRRLVGESGDGLLRLGHRGLKPSDIAVLVLRNQDAQDMKDLLNRLRIPAVLTRSGNVFETGEAEELERLLLAVANPGNSMRMNAALSTRLMGFSGEAIRSFMEDDEQIRTYEQHVERFNAYHDLWVSGGFMGMFRKLTAEYRIRARLLGMPDGERCLTNVLHIAELIHFAAVERKLGMNGVLNWLIDRRAAHQEKDEEELRLESDEDAVQILTVFKSKGLEYPVVFCPAMWQKGAKLSKDDRPFRLYHRNNDFFMDLGSGEWAWADMREQKERLAEQIRLLYVAVTRARSRCYLTLGKIGDPAATALDYLVLGGDGGDDPEIVPRLIQQRKVSEEEWIEKARTYFDDGGGRILFQPVDCLAEMEPFSGSGQTDTDLAVRTFTGRPISDRFWGVVSYSGLTAGERHDVTPVEKTDAKQDEREIAGEVPPEITPEGFFAFPRGSVSGTCIHGIFEDLDFALPDENQALAVIRRHLSASGFSGPIRTGSGMVDPVGIVHGMAQRVLRTPLIPDRSEMRLSDIPAGARMAEMEFYFTLNGLGPAELKRIFAQYAGGENGPPPHYPERIGRLDFRPVQGFMHGFIDLVFRFEDRYYLLDWKTNYLGPRHEDYSFPHLKKAMSDAHYLLQVMVYTVALHHYLKARIPDYDYDRHFGGAFYLFLRGLDPAHPGCGVYFERPEREVVDAFSGFCRGM